MAFQVAALRVNEKRLSFSLMEIIEDVIDAFEFIAEFIAYSRIEDENISSKGLG